ncbi:membrane protein [Pseudomonas oryzihabitans]|uniref:chemotaxis protein CheW n=1 Tax=Pseudomonas rhizoryzae TaxID=2571129 RepID=UPI0007372CA9|nr:chemotaxis protein CheW [Pseudomonas rhizoryzae]KTS79076.1 membrane protein [Pseudomonas psychrotolerans]KTS93185.1 membrane protein [Pseudomonas psychrotolerans]KTT34559.1 membrane protein [Pseudomonas psychrotolerans]KTT37401.1 membrane protein [Pseudomonas psychrotolerans]KTT41325.1 membrane protein [Pseudomonas psychrotolerans]
MGNAELSRQFLTFQLAGDLYGVNTGCVREIIEYGAVTAVPMLPPMLLGVINLRGAAVPVMDLGMRFRNQLTETSRRSCIVVLETQVGEGAQVFGVVVDAVCEVLEIAAEAIEPAPRFGASVRTDFILGMAKQGQGFVILLDMDRVLGEDDLAQLADLSAA